MADGDGAAAEHSPLGRADLDGYIWVATEEGVARFDGAGFVVFDKQNTPELRSNDVRALLATREGDILWACTAAGAARLRGRRMDCTRRSRGSQATTCSPRPSRANGAVWVATSSGLSRLKKAR